MGLLDNTNNQVYHTAGDHGNYQFTSLDDIINSFMMFYVGTDKLIRKVSRADVAFHSQRAMQELSFDTFKSCKAVEIELPPTLVMTLPIDYVNYTKITTSDKNGIEYIIYPTSKTSNPSSELVIDPGGATASPSTPTTSTNYKGADGSGTTDESGMGGRFGLNPENSQANGSFYIDSCAGKIHFSSNISGKTVILDYISDSLGTDGERQVHKFAEDAMYKWISHAILSTRMGVPEYIIQRSKKEKFAATRQAKLRLSNLKIEELTQVLRGKSKQIKH